MFLKQLLNHEQTTSWFGLCLVAGTLFCLPSECFASQAIKDARPKPASAPILACYFTPTSYFPAKLVPASLCTHIIYAFGNVAPTGIQPIHPSDLNNYKTLISLKRENPDLKVILSLQNGFESVVMAGHGVMKSFSLSAVKFLTTIGFDGLDLDWEFPSASQKLRYDQFIQILHAQMSHKNLSLSAALPNSPYKMKGLDVGNLVKYMDFMTVMTYDFHVFSQIDQTTGYNSPLFTPKKEPERLSTSAMMTYYTNVGFPAEKLLMGLPLYGRSWTLADPLQHGLHAPAVAKGGPSPHRKLRGIYLYPDVCVAEEQGAKFVIDRVNGAAYLYQNSTWVAYDGVATVSMKLNWGKTQKFRGVGVWAIHLDDIEGVCNRGVLPLLTYIKGHL